MRAEVIEPISQLSSRDSAAFVEYPRPSSQLAPALLGCILVWEFFALLLGAAHKPFWYDELITLHLSKLQPFSRLAEALHAGADSMPIGYYAIVRLSSLFPGDPLVTLRLPSILGYLLSLVGVYWFTAKRLTGLAGVTAALLISASPFRAFGIEARSYALMVGCLAAAAAVWQRIGEKPLMIPLFGVLLTLAVTCHPLAVFTISCFVLAELAASIRTQSIRWGVWVACAVATSPFLAGLPTALRLRNLYAAHFWSKPSWLTVLLTYDDYMGIHSGFGRTFIAFLVVVIGYSVWKSLRNCAVADAASFKLPEIVLIGSLLAYPALLVTLMKIGNSGYAPRYGWPGILGLALGMIYVLAMLRFFSFPSLLSFSSLLLAALLISFIAQGVNDFAWLVKAAKRSIDPRWEALAAAGRDEPGVPIVIGNGMSFLEESEYGPREIHERVVNIDDPEEAVRLTGTDTVDKTNRGLADFIPMRLEAPLPFLAGHRRFILRSGGYYDWFTPHLLEQKYRMQLIARESDSSIYIAEK